MPIPTPSKFSKEDIEQLRQLLGGKNAAGKKKPEYSGIKTLMDAIKDQWKDDGDYNGEYFDEGNSTRFHRGARGLFKAATKDNPFMTRMFDLMTQKRKGVNSELSNNKFARQPLKANKPSPLLTQLDKEPDESNRSPKQDALFLNVITHLKDIKSILTRMSKDTPVMFKNNAKPMNELVGIIKSDKFMKKLAGIFSKATKKVEPMINNTMTPIFDKIEKLKSNKSDEMVKTTSSESGGILDNIMGGKKGVVGNAVKKAGAGLVRVLNPVAKVTAAAAVGYGAGSLLNNALENSKKGTVLSKVKDAKNEALDSLYSTADVISGGKVSGTNQKTSDEMFSQTKAGKTHKAVSTEMEQLYAGVDKITRGGISGSSKTADEMFSQTKAGKNYESIKSSVSDKFSKVTDTLKELYGNGEKSAHNIMKYIPSLMEELESSGLAKNDKQKSMILGQIAHETGGFKTVNEGKYSPDSVWKMRGKQLERYGVTKDDLIKAKETKGSDAMYEYMYSDKYRSGSSKLGNTEEGDGAKYKGRGLFQLTGKANYKSMSDKIGVDLVENPELANDPKIAAKITTQYLKDNKKATSGLQTENSTLLSKAINGGDIGLSDRLERTDKIYSKLSKSSDNMIAKSNNLEAATIESKDKSSKQQPIVITGNNNNSAPSAPVQSGAVKPPAPVIAHNTESSIRRLTDSQMSYGVV